MALLVSPAACVSVPLAPTPVEMPTESTGEPTQAPGDSQAVQPVPTEELPSPTPEPLAFAVNGEAITLAEFKEAVTRYQAARETRLPVDQAANAVLQDLVDSLLLAQAARAAGFVVDDAMLDQRIAALAEQVGGSEQLVTWQAANGYSPDSFRTDLRRSIEAAWMRDQVAAGVPERMAQVRARQVLLYNEDEAKKVLAGLSSGTSFSTMLAIYDPYSLGEMGWFPQGYLDYPAIEQAAFALQPGQTSDIIQTELGYHILQVVEVQPDRPLDPAVRLVLQEKMLREWLAAQRETSEIMIYLSETKEELR